MDELLAPVQDLFEGQIVCHYFPFAVALRRVETPG